MLDYLGGSNVITRVHKNRRGNLKKGPEKWQCEKDWAQNFWPWRWKEATAKECWWPLKAGKDQNNNNNRISWEPSEGVQPCQCFAFRSMTLILNLWSSELWWWCSSLSHQGLCSWGASLHPRLQVSLAPSFHRQFPERMCCLDVWTQETNMLTGKKTVLCISFLLETLMRETEEASLIQMSKWKPGGLSPVTAGLIPGSNQLYFFIHIEHTVPVPTSLCLSSCCSSLLGPPFFYSLSVHSSGSNLLSMQLLQPVSTALLVTRVLLLWTFCLFVFLIKFNYH